jgi:hypothetical protein
MTRQEYVAGLSNVELYESMILAAEEFVGINQDPNATKGEKIYNKEFYGVYLKEMARRLKGIGFLPEDYDWRQFDDE